eukprot:TRINITY_DN23363_c0_g1_i3.p1 TRINITY_DN23363_c0_g1~~TRINITY_DN23363_c0_g1_i3.p1  ORF type:complete len:382 (+),score=99.96 TRINITY_DN23363_c0_g1_i3:19-1164(+)
MSAAPAEEQHEEHTDANLEGVHVSVTGWDWKDCASYTVQSRVTGRTSEGSDATHGLPAGEYTVSRRYKHFDWLLTRLYQETPYHNVPVCPPKELRVGSTSQADPRFLEYRRVLLDKCLQDVCRRPELTRSEALKIFLTSPDLLFECDLNKLSAPREFDQTVGKNVSMFAKLKLKTKSAAPPDCEAQYRELMGMAASGAKLSKVCHAASAAELNRLTALKGVCDALKNYGLATGTPHQYLTSHQVGQGFREVAIELETMADHQEHMGVQVDHAYHRLVDQACRSVEGCSRVYKARQSALQLRDHHEVSKLELGECAQNLETFEAALPHEIEYSQGRFLHDGESLVRELPGIRKQAILKELAQWEHIEKIMCEMQDSTATPSK